MAAVQSKLHYPTVAIGASCNGTTGGKTALRAGNTGTFRAFSRTPCACVLLIGVGLAACGEPADNASPSAPNEGDLLPTPSRPAPNWNCGPRCWREEAVPSAVVDAFDSTVDNVDLQPELVYPLDGSVHPINLNTVTFQFRRGNQAQRWFDIRLSTVSGSSPRSYDFITPCHAPPLNDTSDANAAAVDRCVYDIPVDMWRSIAEDHAGQTLRVSIGSMESAATPVHRSADYSITFSDTAISGGFYYWSTALGGTYRLPFGATQAVPWIAPGTASNPSACGGCHAVSRNGSVIAFTSDAAAGYLQVSDAADPTQKRIASEGTRNSSMLALNRTGSRVLVAFDGRLTLRDTSDGTVLAEADETLFGNERTAYFPEFSADDREVVVTLSDAPDSFWSVVTGELAIMPISGDEFGEPRVIASTPDQVHFYPSWSPNGEWILFASAPIFSLSYDQPNARLCVVHRDGGPIYELSNATQGIGNTSTLPKFAPFVQADGSMFFTFNSKLDYGFLLENSAQASAAARLPQLWLSLFDPARIDREDPSSAPVWLPFQSVDQRNHLGLWTERVSCGEGTEQVSVCGPGEICIDNACRVLR